MKKFLILVAIFNLSNVLFINADESSVSGALQSTGLQPTPGLNYIPLAIGTDDFKIQDGQVRAGPINLVPGAPAAPVPPYTMECPNEEDGCGGKKKVKMYNYSDPAYLDATAAYYDKWTDHANPRPLVAVGSMHGAVSCGTKVNGYTTCEGNDPAFSIDSSDFSTNLDDGIMAICPNGQSYMIVASSGWILIKDPTGKLSLDPRSKSTDAIAQLASQEYFRIPTNLQRATPDVVYPKGTRIVMFDDTRDMAGSVDITALITAVPVIPSVVSSSSSSSSSAPGSSNQVQWKINAILQGN